MACLNVAPLLTATPIARVGSRETGVAAAARLCWRMPHVVSTAQVDAAHRVAYWTDLVCDTYVQLECDP